jgi:uncharacterized protein (TIGR02145 family)
MKHSIGLLILALSLVAGCKKDQAKTLAQLTTTAISNITSTSAQTGGDITGDGGSPISQSGICWATHSNPTVGDSTSQAGTSGGSFSISLSNLNANTTYYVRAYAINGSGTAYGNDDSLMTSKGLPTIITSTVTNIIPLVATSGGNVTNDGGASVTARGLCYSTSPHPTISNFITSDSNGIGAFIDSMKPLASQTQYYVRAYATNSFGTAYGNEINFTSSSANTVTDIDGNVYSYIVIGGQTWMTSNLKVTHYQNGDPVINGLATNFNWWNDSYDSLYVGAYTFPNGDTTQKAAYGLLYNNYACNDSRNIAPVGWHVATDGDWETLEFNEGMLASDTGSAAFFRNFTNPIGPVLETGGSSGLNLQFAGEYDISSTTNSFSNFQSSFFYYTSSPLNIGRIGNFYRYLGPATNVGRSIGYTTAGAVRCVKN